MGGNVYFYREQDERVPVRTAFRLLKGAFSYQGTFLADKRERAVLCFDDISYWHTQTITSAVLNGVTLNPGAFQPNYVGRPGRIVRGQDVQLIPGENVLTLEGWTDDEAMTEESLHVCACAAQTIVRRPPAYSRMMDVCDDEWTEEDRPMDTTGYRRGIGFAPTPGRFAFTKGDGLLDCAMPYLGGIDKMYLCGHPDYHHRYRWHYNTLPEGQLRHGSLPLAECGIKQDEISVNYLSTVWRTTFDEVAYSCTYSIGSPGIITEISSGIMRLSDLEFAGNYQYVMLPRPGGRLEIVTLQDLHDLTLGGNYLLLFGCTEFPDVPLMLVFQRQPASLEKEFSRSTGRLSALVFTGCSLLITATPFGLETFQPLQPDDASFCERAAKVCAFWSRAMLAYPTSCREYYKHDRERERIRIIQEFGYRFIRDDWGTVPLKTAPLPPVTSTCGIAQCPKTAEVQFPTKYGYLRVISGSSHAAYEVPVMPSKRRFPLKTHGSKLPDLLKDDLKAFRAFQEHFPESVQSYPYAGALMEPFAWNASLLTFMEEDDRSWFRRHMARRLCLACDEDYEASYAVINHALMMKRMPDDNELCAIYDDSDMRYRKIFNWFRRKEPFTGVSYDLCYINVGFYSSGRLKTGSRQEVANFSYPLIENDWGLGLTFYYMYLCVLATGDLRPVRENWDLLKSAYSFFWNMHDWACMGTGYSDNAILWVEGANYGAFTSFINLAELVQDEEAYEEAVYLGAKQLALRMSLLGVSQDYFAKLYHVKPWYGTRLYCEEANPQPQHTGYPKESIAFNGLRKDAIYNMTTEGLYPEYFEACRRFRPDCTDIIMNGMLELLEAQPELMHQDSWTMMQMHSSALLYYALDERTDREKLLAKMRFAEEHQHLMTRWRGIHVFSRRLPKNYWKTQLMAWNDMKEHPMWLEEWQGLVVESAEWNPERRQATVAVRLTEQLAAIRCGIRSGYLPMRILWNGKPTEVKEVKGGFVCYGEKTGILTVDMSRETEKDGGRMEVLLSGKDMR